MDIRYNTFSNKQNFASVGLILIFVCIVMLGFVASTLAFFYYSDFSNEALTMSGKVKIEAVGEGDLTIEDDTRCNLQIKFADEYDVLIPGMPIDMPANCKVYASTTKPLLRAMLTLDFEGPMANALETYSEEYTDESIVLQGLLSQFADEIESNGWYMHTDSYYYYVGTNATIQGSSTTLVEVDATVDPTKDYVVVPFIDSEVKFPTEVDSTYSGSKFNVKITFQAIQNYIPDEHGDKMDNTIKNSQKIFNRFYASTFTETPIEMFKVTKSGNQVILNLDPSVTYPETVVLPATDAEGNKITTIGKDFGLATNIKNIVVTSSAYTTIEQGAFQNNKNIQNIDLSMTSITEIPENCFYKSTLSSIILPEGLETLGEYAFAQTSLLSISLPDSVKTLRVGSLYVTKLQSLYIPANVEIINANAVTSTQLATIVVDENNPYFYDTEDSNIISYDGRFVVLAMLYPNETFIIPEGVTRIMRNAFYNCVNLQEVVLSSTISIIENVCFRYTINRVVVPDNNTHFSSPTGRELISSNGELIQFFYEMGECEYTIPDEVTTIREHAFHGKESAKLEKLIIGPNVSVPPRLWLNRIKLIEIKNNLNMIVDCGIALYDNSNNLIAFAGRANIDEYTILDGTKQITMEATLYNHYITKVVVPSSVVSINNFLHNCNNLVILVFNCVVPPTFISTKSLHSGTRNSNFRIYVPDSAVNTYKSTEGYSQYADIIFGISQMP